MSLFNKCCVCGRTVYTDGMGDDVIPKGYITDDGWVCEDDFGDDEEDYDEGEDEDDN